MNTKQQMIKELEELKARQEKLENLINQLPDPKKSSVRQKPKTGVTYYAIDSGITVFSVTWSDNNLDNTRFAVGNVYNNRRAAQTVADKQLATVRVTDRIAELNAEQDWVVDWNDPCQMKYTLFFSYDSGRLYVVWRSNNKHPYVAMYGSRETIERVMTEMPNDCKLMLEVD